MAWDGKEDRHAHACWLAAFFSPLVSGRGVEGDGVCVGCGRLRHASGTDATPACTAVSAAAAAAPSASAPRQDGFFLLLRCCGCLTRLRAGVVMARQGRHDGCCSFRMHAVSGALRDFPVPLRCRYLDRNHGCSSDLLRLTIGAQRLACIVSLLVAVLWQLGIKFAAQASARPAVFRRLQPHLLPPPT